MTVMQSIKPNTSLAEHLKTITTINQNPCTGTASIFHYCGIWCGTWTT